MRSSILKSLIYMPIMFFLWYVLSPLISILVSFVISYPVKYFTSGLIHSINSAGLEVQGVIRLAGGTYGELIIPSGKFADIMLTARPMVYGYGIPLFATLLIAFARGKVVSFKIILCFLLLFLSVCFGTMMELIKIIFLSMDSSITETIRVAQWKLELIAISYQVGTLILPAVLPISLWLLLNEEFFSEKFNEE